MPVMEGVVQQTSEWLSARVGVATTSRLGDMMSRLKVKSKNGEKGEPSARCINYRKEIVYECLTGLSADHYVTKFMDIGTENEPLAIAAYEIEAGVEVQPGGFWIHDEISRFGSSPDGLVGEHGLIEAKCPPSFSAHLDTIRSGEIPEDYQLQMLGEMACTGRQWCDYVSFNPDMPKHLRLFIKRLQRNEERIKAIQDAVCEFLLEVIADLKELEPK